MRRAGGASCWPGWFKSPPPDPPRVRTARSQAMPSWRWASTRDRETRPGPFA